MPTLRLVRETGWSAMVRGALDELDLMRVKRLGLSMDIAVIFKKKVNESEC